MSSQSGNQALQECYMCNSLAVSQEHVPPRCLFPERKDTEGIDYRKNLITVPSCEKHNSEKSNDDEFLMATLAPIVGNNVLGYSHTMAKIKRALDRKKKNFANYTIYNEKPFLFQTRSGRKYPVLRGSPDLMRLHNCFTHIAYGLYYKEFGKRFEGECRIFVGFVKYSNPSYERVKILARVDCIEKMHSMSLKGDNPEVFYYQIFPPDDNQIILIRLIFYEASDVFISLRLKDAPFNLALELSNISRSISFRMSNGRMLTINHE